MSSVTHAPLARRDLDDIWDYIATDNMDAADRLLRQIGLKARSHAETPSMGTPRDELLPAMRSFPVGNYVIFYREVPGGIELIRVLHGARSFRRMFD